MSPLPDIVQVQHAGGTSPVIIQAGLIDAIGGWLAPYLNADHVVVVTDDQVWAALGERLLAAALKANVAVVPIVVPGGETAKSWDSLANLIDRLLSLGVERGDTILAFGGGVIGDLTGFASAILKRGCNYIQVPTSLLAQVDSSVGGKTAINTAAGKNLVGAFHQPAAVFIDPTVLESLPDRHIRAGYAEIVKYGLIGDPDFYDWCELKGPGVIVGNTALRGHAILTSVRAKAAIVGRDERELVGQRALLNFGHSFAHALEAETGFSDALLHGEAVAVGMVLAFRFSTRRGLCAVNDLQRVSAHLAACGLPTRLSEIGISADGARLASHMRYDKKNLQGSQTLVLTRGIGAAFLKHEVALSEVARFLEAELGSKAACDAPLR